MISLIRKHSSNKGTYGELIVDGMLAAHTCELPWKHNQRNISCIPTGTYKVKRRWSPKYKSHWIIQDVPNRSYILFHAGTFLADTRGCVLVGDRYLRDNNGIMGVGNSRTTMKRLQAILPRKFDLIIL